ncbi:MAG TPA: uroporphyrinogen decarboxylase family protein [Armatimonadota bacterium]|nr:uroporphyrinogen decarboxylase family protein [Armatimonadota bacterium]HQK93022.1 uroporphyrinogen decarboxylase family protein [Armatimonadota bacterium]
MTSRERVLLALDHKEADRIAITDGPWGTTIARWHREGLPEDKSPHEYFGFEFGGTGCDGSLQLPSEVIEDTPEYSIARNADGATVKNWKSSTSTPELLGFAINTRAKWEEHRDRMAWNDTRVDWDNALKSHNAGREAGLFCPYAAAIGYDRTAMLVGPEDLLMAFVEDPDWVRDMFRANAELNINAMEEMMARGFVFDGVFFYDDMGYKHRPFFSPRAYREVLMPYHKRLCDFAHGRGLKVILHSCGNVNQHVPALIEAGFDCLQPLEVKAGMDLVQLKKDYGDVLALMGGIDVRAMADPDPAVIEREIATKIPIAKKGGGYIYHSDHSVPDNVSFAQFCRTIELVLKYGTYT